MINEEKKSAIQVVFNTVANGYGQSAMRFFDDAAAILPEFYQLKGDEQILDVACGTGIASCILAGAHPAAHVTGVDFSEAMLLQARRSAEQNELKNLDFEFMDMTQMQLPACHFDVANCSFGLFFVEDICALVKHITAKLKPNGLIGACSFESDSFQPLLALFLKRIESFGIEPPPFGWRQLDSEEKFRELYESADLVCLKTQTIDVSYILTDQSQWWDIIWNAGFRGLVAQLDQKALTKFKQEHLHEVEQLRRPEGIPLQIKIVFALAQVTKISA
ncbi:MAG: methyltransferase domain-containing protein [Gammaproteobacteria bacterium]|nr:methyltransferase domain-containing protein [Gammaproteobacteria bacterium]MDH5730977.1 methyltransferase domain-containing protein [Gammaproteobacteria bacterium]